MTRTFIAIELSAAARQHLQREIHRLAQVLPHVRWVEPESLHLTLAFLGELDAEQLAAATAATQEAARLARPFTLHIAALGTFGPAHQPRVIWAGVAGDLPQLMALQEKLAAILAAKGFPSQEYAYSPHLTLARIKDPLSQSELADLRHLIAPPPPFHAQSHRQPQSRAGKSVRKAGPETPSISAEQLCVMKSELARGGAQYTCLQACAFAS